MLRLRERHDWNCRYRHEGIQSVGIKKINIILISQASSEQNICIAILPQYVEPASFALEEEFQLEMEGGK